MSGPWPTRLRWAGLLGLLVSWIAAGVAQEAPPPVRWAESVLATNRADGFTLGFKEGRVRRFERRTGKDEEAVPPAVLLVGDRLNVTPLGRALVLQLHQAAALDERTEVEVLRPNQLLLKSGRLYFKSIGPLAPGGTWVQTPLGPVRAQGTEFHLEVTEAGGVELFLRDGRAEVGEGATNASAFAPGDRIQWLPGQVPVKEQAALETFNQLIQWVLYYPAVLELSELPQDLALEPALAEAVRAYQRGNVPAALAAYPAGRTPASVSEKLFRAALLLAVGRVDQAEELLATVPSTAGSADGFDREARLAGALRRLVASVKLMPMTDAAEPVLATEWLAESYHRQAQGDLGGALGAARRAAVIAPGSGYAQVRQAELLFSAGRSRESRAALALALELTPEHAEAHALQGFVLSARNRHADALRAFETAVALDGRLGNAWLGLGLCLIRQGRVAEGLQSLQVAVAQEPQRALLRSYLGKGYEVAGASRAARRSLQMSEADAVTRAEESLRRAGELDPRDPTPALYRALMAQRDNRINEAVGNLELSQSLNDNRSVFRSGLLLDQDRAVRSANLASIYRDAGMSDLSVREASRAVTADYGNASAHLFLANSYDALRDPRQITLRYETPWLSEWLVAQLLQPVGAGSLSQTVSQQEYSRMFERDRLGVFSRTEYLSNGDWLQSASQYGTVGNTAYALDAFYLSQNGQRVNDDLESLTFWGTVKQQLTADDSVFLQAGYYDFESGDTRQLYDPADALTSLRVEETQQPTLLAGYHHIWSPEHQTLFLGGWVDGTFSTTAPQTPGQVLFRSQQGNPLPDFPPVGFFRDLDYESDQELFTAELQHIWQTGRWTTIAGVRYQHEEFDTHSVLSNPTGISAWPPIVFTDVLADQQVVSTFERFSAYAYEYWEALPGRLTLVGGLAHDYVEFPVNHRVAPISTEQDSLSKLSPKAGFILVPLTNTTLRASYTRSLGGVSYDQSFRLEPVQVAGFVQSHRSVIPEAVFGSLAVPELETAGVLLDHRFPTRTYAAVGAEWLSSKADQQVGGFESRFGDPLAAVSIANQIDYEESSVSATLNQLLGEWWSVGARYRLSLTTADQEIDNPDFVSGRQEATLHAVDAYALMNLPCGFFSEFQALWRAQSNTGYDPDQPGDDFAQFNLYAGYRFARRRCEVRVGVLNLTDQDYRLNPLSFYAELPRDRMFYASLKLDF